ncbi:MAG: cupin domain-containing protein [Bryobacterales bacterium]|nr:cupin domain-containing protein [Bryobacterales bacterium]
MLRNLFVFSLACIAFAAERGVDPTFLRRSIPDVPVKAGYRALFGEGDAGAAHLKGISRFGEVTVGSAGTPPEESFSGEERIYFVTEGAGTLRYSGGDHAVRREDFFYVPPGVKHGLSISGADPLRAIVMGFRIPKSATVKIPSKLLLANLADVKKQTVGSHPPSTLYQLMIGDTRSTRDKIAAGHVVTSLFVMEITPGGTNHPHHHDTEEEIYFLLDGRGEMVAGGGMDGIEGRFPAKPGDAYFFRLNTTVGFYNASGPGASTARILAVRSLYPRGRGE